MKDVETALLAAVGERVAAFGFDRKPVGQSFFRRFAGGKASCHLAFVRHAGDFDVITDVAVRFDQLEDLLNADNRLLTAKEKRQTFSLGAELGNIARQGQRRWKVSSLEDVDPIAEQLSASFESIGLPYIEAASTLEGAYQLLATPGRDSWLHSPIHAARAKRVLGLAKLLGYADELQAKAKQNVQLLESLNDPGLNDFKEFASRLGIDL